MIVRIGLIQLIQRAGLVGPNLSRAPFLATPSVGRFYAWRVPFAGQLGLLPDCSSEHNLMGVPTRQCAGGEQLRRYSSVTVCRGVCLTRLEETQI